MTNKIAFVKAVIQEKIVQKKYVLMIVHSTEYAKIKNVIAQMVSLEKIAHYLLVQTDVMEMAIAETENVFVTINTKDLIVQF